MRAISLLLILLFINISGVFAQPLTFVSQSVQEKLTRLSGFIEDMTPEAWQQEIIQLAEKIFVLTDANTILAKCTHVDFHREDCFENGCLARRADIYQHHVCVYQVRAMFACAIAQQKASSASDIWLFEQDQVTRDIRCQYIKFQDGQTEQHWIEHISAMQSNASWGYTTSEPIAAGFYQVTTRAAQQPYWLRKNNQWFISKHVKGTARAPEQLDINMPDSFDYFGYFDPLSKRGTTSQFSFEAVFYAPKVPIELPEHILLPLCLHDGIYSVDLAQKTCTLLDHHLRAVTTYPIFLVTELVEVAEVVEAPVADPQVY